MTKQVLIVSFFIFALLTGCANTQQKAPTITKKIPLCTEVPLVEKGSFFGQGYGVSYEIAMNNAQIQLSNNISSEVKSKVALEERVINGVVSTLFESTAVVTTDMVPIDGYELIDTCLLNKNHRVSLQLKKESYKKILRQKLLKQMADIDQLITKQANQDQYYQQKTSKKLSGLYQALVQSKYLNGIYGESLSMVDTVKLFRTEYLVKNILKDQKDSLIGVKYSNKSHFAAGYLEEALNKAGFNVTNDLAKSHSYLELVTTDANTQEDSQFITKLQLQLNVKKSQNNDIIQTLNIGTAVGYSLTSQAIARANAQRNLKYKLDQFVTSKFKFLAKKLKS